MRLLPREEKFFVFFNQQTKIIAEAARLLLEGVKAGNDRLAKASLEIVELEHKGDEIIHDIFTKLNHTFITPIDPEDIHALASCLDDVLDGIEDTAHRLAAYRLEPVPPAMLELTEIVHQCANTLVKAFVALEHDQPAPLLEHCIEINRLEDIADHIVRREITDLFRNETNAITVIKLKEVYDFLELTTDRAEDVADALQSVVVKNS